MDLKQLKKLKQDNIIQTNFNQQHLVLHTTWGLFSPKEVDEGSVLLMKNIEVARDDVCLDLGCGYGVIGLTLAKMASQGKVHLVDKDFVAVDYSKKNTELNQLENCEVYLSNGFSNVPDIKFDKIVSNLPAKVGKELLYIIMNEAKGHLKVGGKFYVVVIAGLKEYIKRNFKEVFGNYKKIKQSKTYMVAVAVKEK